MKAGPCQHVGKKKKKTCQVVFDVAVDRFFFLSGCQACQVVVRFLK
jgi:hypothetical protein